MLLTFTGEEGRYDDLATWWLPTDALEPLILVEGIDGAFYPWDGCHRIGVSTAADQTTAPAIVGYRKRKEG